MNVTAVRLLRENAMPHAFKTKITCLIKVI
jgi:hypothetical protein